MVTGATMPPVQFGLVIPAGSPTREGRATFVADLNRALHLIAGHFDSAWMIDHLQPDTTDLLERLYDDQLSCGAASPTQVRPDRHLPVVPQPGAAGEDGRNAAIPERRAVYPWAWRGLERRGIPRL